MASSGMWWRNKELRQILSTANEREPAKVHFPIPDPRKFPRTPSWPAADEFADREH